MFSTQIYFHRCSWNSQNLYCHTDDVLLKSTVNPNDFYRVYNTTALENFTLSLHSQSGNNHSHSIFLSSLFHRQDCD